MDVQLAFEFVLSDTTDFPEPLHHETDRAGIRVGEGNIFRLTPLGQVRAHFKTALSFPRKRESRVKTDPRFREDDVVKWALKHQPCNPQVFSRQARNFLPCHRFNRGHFLGPTTLCCLRTLQSVPIPTLSLDLVQAIQLLRCQLDLLSPPTDGSFRDAKWKLGTDLSVAQPSLPQDLNLLFLFPPLEGI